ncbi:GNAT family N-acetyltransferase [bacterium]|jgi:ribosomal protein S18 acetylase RimI-like enzyme|nr:GNAT family N-acetyltransferase [bacterium]MBT6294054.1 GNAT family N-acetyltransferase [bacterium]
MISIRLFSALDFSEVSRITVDCFEKINFINMNPDELKYAKEYYSTTKLLESTKSFDFYICKFNNQIVGSVAFNKNQLHNLFVDPNFHKMGIGKKLLEFAESIIFENYSDVVLDSSPYAVGFYKKFGYEILDNSKNKLGLAISMKKEKP